MKAHKRKKHKKNLIYLNKMTIIMI